jgi:imidazole glycerol-phosphate synthase subunit HisF
MTRIIARLDIKNGLVIKGIQFDGQRRIGDPVSLALKYYLQGVDELLFLDSVATLYGNGALFEIISSACRSVFVPITMGGGIKSIDDVALAIKAGADKIAVNSALVKSPALVNEISSRYGSQCLIGSIEGKKAGPSSWQVYINNGRDPTGMNVVDWAIELEQRGVGELLVTSVDVDGTQRGMDNDLISIVRSAVNIPVIASGGVGRLEHIESLYKKTYVDAIALASSLHYEKLTIFEVKSLIKKLNCAK